MIPVPVAAARNTNSAAAETHKQLKKKLSCTADNRNIFFYKGDEFTCSNWNRSDWAFPVMMKN